MPNQDQDQDKYTGQHSDNVSANQSMQEDKPLYDEAQGAPPQQPPQQQLNELQNKITQVEERFNARIQTLEKQIQALEGKTGELAATKRTLEEKTGELAATKQDLATTKQTLEAKTQELERTKRTLEEKTGELATTKQTLEEKTGELAATKRTLEEKTGELAATKQDLATTQQELERTKAERFQRGWELFKIYQKKEASFHDALKLKGVIPRADNFESFICSGVSSDSLETLWDIIKDRRYRGETKDLQFLQDLFEYRLELFNASKSAPVYEMLKVQVGDPYMQREQVVDSSGSSQGVVREVCLQGYRNRIVDKIIRQTIVILE